MSGSTRKAGDGNFGLAAVVQRTTVIQVKQAEHEYDRAVWLTVRGLGALGEGENLKLCMGESIIIGRSRHCDWSVKRSPGYLGLSDSERKALQKNLSYRSVSRQHVRIAFLAPDMVELENLSGNGTLVDGARVDRIILRDCQTTTHRIQLGPKGVILDLCPGSLPVDVPA